MQLFQWLCFKRWDSVCIAPRNAWKWEYPGTAQLGSAEKAIMEALSASYSPFNNSAPLCHPRNTLTYLTTAPCICVGTHFIQCISVRKCNHFSLSLCANCFLNLKIYRVLGEVVLSSFVLGKPLNNWKTTELHVPARTMHLVSLL